jgi:hypothetical protein
MSIKTSVIVGVTSALTLCSVAFADLAIHYDSCGFRSLTWNAVAGAATYKVERKECDNCMGEWKTLSLEADTSTDDLDSPALTYRVRALSIGGVVLETALLAGDGVTVPRLSITPTNPELPVTACGAPLQLELRGTIPASGVTFEWRRNGVVVATTSVPLLNVAVTAEDCGAEYSVTAQSACGVSQCQWAPVSTVGARSSPVWRWISIAKTNTWHKVGTWHDQCCNDPGYPGQCTDNAEYSSAWTTGGPCEQGSLSPGMFTAEASETHWWHYELYCWSLCEFCRYWLWFTDEFVGWNSQAQIADPGNLLLTVVGRGSCEVWNNGKLLAATYMQPVELNMQLQPGNVSLRFWKDGDPNATSQTSPIVSTLQGIFTPTFPDCNSNLRPDATDITSGLSADIDANNTPDECQTVNVPGQYASIQAAIDAAPSNEMRIISVAAGTYAGPIAFNGKPVIVRGTGAANTVIDGTDGQPLSVVRFTGGEPAIAALEGVTVRHGATGTPFPGAPQFLVGGGVFAYNSAANIYNCVIEENSAAFGAGAYFWNCSGKIERCIVRGNTASDDAGGIQLYRGSPQVIDSIIENNSAGNRGGGMHLVGGTPALMQTIVRDNQSSNTVGGISWVPASQADAFLRITDCTIRGNTAINSSGGIGILSDGDQIKTGIQGTDVCANTPDPNITGVWNDLGANAACNCPGDLNADGIVDGADLGHLLGSWFACQGGCASDLNRDGVVNGADLGILLSAWGSCR